MPETILLRASAPVSHKSGELLSLSPEEMRVQTAEPRGGSERHRHNYIPGACQGTSGDSQRKAGREESRQDGIIGTGWWKGAKD